MQPTNARLPGLAVPGFGDGRMNYRVINLNSREVLSLDAIATYEEASKIACECEQDESQPDTAIEKLVGGEWVKTSISEGEVTACGIADDADAFGDLHDYNTAEFIRPATSDERDASRDAPSGVILIDSEGNGVDETDRNASDARRVYVEE